MKKDFLASFIQFITTHKLCTKKQHILLAVSGGLDSRVLVKSFFQSGYNIGIAHINFGLRGKESNGDEQFVKQLAKNLEVPFFSTRFDTLKEAEGKKISIQMAARNLRYTWLETVRKTNNFNAIGVAHHLQDVTETMLINLLRGTGIAGLHGILPVQGKIIRPILFASKEEIENFATENKLKWREDSSNEKDDYTRNLIRHHVLPVFKKINPSFEKTFGENAARFFQSEIIVNEYIGSIENTITHIDRNGDLLLIKKFFEAHPAGEVLLYELLKRYHFTAAVISDMLKETKIKSGRLFFSDTHQLLINRENYIVSAREPVSRETLFYQNDDHLEIRQKNFILKLFPLQMDADLYNRILKNKNKFLAYADADKVKFPFGVRTWEAGDQFFPFGMKGKKKISDFYIDLKLSLTEKERTWLLTDDEKIIWVMGYRQDNRVAITKQTKNCYRCEFIKL